MKHCAVIDIGSSKVMCMVVRPDADGAIVVLGSGIISYPGYRYGSLPNIHSLSDAIGAAVAQASEEAGVRVRYACAAVPSPFIKLVKTKGEIRPCAKNGKICSEDIDLLLEASEARERYDDYLLLHSTPYAFYIDSAPASGAVLGVPCRTLSASVSHVYADRAFCGIAAEAARLCGITLAPFISASMAASLFSIPSDVRRSGVVLVDCGASHTDVSLIRDDALIASASIPIGGRHIANDIALGLRLPFGVSEELKRRYVYGLDYGDSIERIIIPNEGVASVERATIQMIIEARTDELCQMLREALDLIAPDASVPIYMVGGGIALMRGSDEYLRRSICRHIQIAMPRSNRCGGANYAIAFGLAQFMLYYRRESMGHDTSIINNIRDFFIS